jgi:hypothetical protein
MIKLRMFYRIMAVLLLTDPGQVAFAQDRPQVNCVASKMAWLETKLFMGLSRSGGAAVSRREWDEFVTDNFVASFPQGFTIIETTGYWQHENTKATVYENG